MPKIVGSTYPPHIIHKMVGVVCFETRSILFNTHVLDKVCLNMVSTIKTLFHVGTCLVV